MIVRAKDRVAKEHRKQEEVRRQVRRKENSTRRRTNFDFDLWGGDMTKDEDEKKKEQEDVDWVEDNTRRHNLKGTGRMKRATPTDLHRKPSDLSAVSAPHGGASYNPSYADHQDLLRKAWVAEINKDAAQHKIDYHTTRMFPKASEAPTEQTWLKEMTEGIGQEEDEEQDHVVEEEEEEKEDEDMPRREVGKLKTRKQRRQYKERMAEERKVKRAKKTKEVEQDVFRLRSLKREIAGEERRISERSAKRAAEKLMRERTQPAMLSKHKFQEADLEIKLSEELTGNLRSLKPEGNLLEDRYKSMQRRNMVETRVKTKIVKKKHKRKKLEKRSYKMPWEKQNV